MRPPRSDLAPIIQLLAIFFVGTAFALHSLTNAAETTSPVLLNGILVEQEPSCTCHVVHTTQNTTIVELQLHVQSMVMQEPLFAHGTQSDPTTPFSNLPLQAPSKPAEHCPSIQFPASELRRSSSQSIRSRINAARLSVLEIVPPTKSLRALLPAGRRDLSAIAASALRLGSSSLHVAAAMIALFFIGSIMCTL
ncbi:hypothetical protein VUR80DRAFT_6066 [Thermomyces stellatus]